MPPRQDTSGPILIDIRADIATIKQRMVSIEQRLDRQEQQPHTACPSPVLAQRVTALEAEQREQTVTLSHIGDKVDASRAERYEQVNDLRKETAANFDRLTNTLKWVVGTVIAVAGLTVAALKFLGV